MKRERTVHDMVIPILNVCEIAVARFMAKDELLPLLHDLGISGHKDEAMMIFNQQVIIKTFHNMSNILQIYIYIHCHMTGVTHSGHERRQTSQFRRVRARLQRGQSTSRVAAMHSCSHTDITLLMCRSS